MVTTIAVSIEETVVQPMCCGSAELKDTQIVEPKE
jgi:hypothetical protein